MADENKLRSVTENKEDIDMNADSEKVSSRELTSEQQEQVSEEDIGAPSSRLVLPKSTNLRLNDQNIPSVRGIPSADALNTSATLIGAYDYDKNLVTFWLADIILSILCTLEEKRVSQRGKSVMLAWFEYLLLQVSDVSKTRHEVFANLRSLVFAAESHVNNPTYELPAPDEIGVAQKTGSKKRTIKLNLSSNTNTEELTFIIESLYSVFANNLSFNIIRSVFSSPPSFNVIEWKYQVNHAKKLKPVEIEPHDPFKKRPKRGISKLETQKHGKKVRENASKEIEKEKPHHVEDKTKYVLPLKDAVSREYFDTLFSRKKAKDDGRRDRRAAYRKGKEERRSKLEEDKGKEERSRAESVVVSKVGRGKKNGKKS